MPIFLQIYNYYSELPNIFVFFRQFPKLIKNVLSRFFYMQINMRDFRKKAVPLHVIFEKMQKQTII